jgi:hypothetical protein
MSVPAPLVQTLTIGRLKVHALQAGGQQLDGGAMFGVVPKPLWERRIKADERNRIQLGMRCLLIEHERGLVLIDNGAGNKETPNDVKVSLYKSLATAAKMYGNRLEQPATATLLKVVADETDAEIRSAAAEAMGALNLETQQARQLILQQYQTPPKDKAAKSGAEQAKRD